MRPLVVGDETMALAEIDFAALTGDAFPPGHRRLPAAPGPNGWPSIDRIHQAAAESGCAIIVLVPASRERLPADYRRLPRTHFLTKPAKESELIDAVRLALGDNRREPYPGDAVAAERSTASDSAWPRTGRSIRKSPLGC